MLKTLRQRLGLVIAALAMLAGATAITTGAVAPTAAPVVAPKAAAAYASNITMCWHSGFAKYKITFNNSLAPGTYHILVSNGSYGSWWLSDSLAQTWQNNLFFYDSNWVNGVTSYGAPGVSSIWRSSTYTGWC